jgi:hypothetical protein
MLIVGTTTAGTCASKIKKESMFRSWKAWSKYI